jgi:RND family efflux transporter MFP subunit
VQAVTRTVLFLLMLLPVALCAAADAPVRKPMGPAAVATAAAAPAAAAPITPVRVLIAASREAKLSAQMDGRLVSLPKSTGAAFRRGDVLAEFDCSSQRAELAVNKARLEKARSTLESQKTLRELNAISELDLVQAQTDAQEAAARLEQAEVGVSRCRLLAPYAGKVVRRVANEFETLGPGATILEIVETGPLRLELLVPSRWLVWLKNGTAFSVHVDEISREVAAKVTGIGSRVDPVSQTVSVQAVFTENVPGILPGMSGNARFPGAQP